MIRVVPRRLASEESIKRGEPAGLGRPNDPANSILIQLFRKQLPPLTERRRGAAHHAPS